MKFNQNLLLTAGEKVKNLRLHKSMWSMAGIKHDTIEKLRECVKKTNSDGYNVFHLAIMHNKLEIIQWIWQKLSRDVFGESEMVKFVKTTSADGKNVLQLAAACNKSAEVHDWLWNVINSTFGSDALKEFVEHQDKDERNVFHTAALLNSNAIFTKIYQLAKQLLGAIEMRKCLRKKEIVYDANVFDIAKDHAVDKEIHAWLKTKRHKYF
jgi:hypothetical protein